MKRLIYALMLLLLTSQGAWAQTAAAMPSMAVSQQTITEYRNEIAAKVNKDPAKEIIFTDQELGEFIGYCESIQLAHADIVALLSVKVRKNWVNLKGMTAVADVIAQQGRKNQIQFQEGFTFLTAYQRIQDSLLIGRTFLPAGYLDAGYLDTRIAAFEGGASYLLTTTNYQKYVQGKPFAGFPDGQFVAPPSVISQVLETANGDIASIEQQLGIPAGAWQGKGGIYRIDVADAVKLQLRLPNGGEMGANEFWIPGGYTSGGVAEGFVNQIPLAAYTATQVVK
jgi:hypothetical protein